MNELHKALVEIGSIRRQLAHSTEFRGYGPATLAATAALAACAALAQPLVVSRPGASIGRYLALWLSTALAAAVLTGIQTWTRSRRMHSGLSSEMLHMAVQQFLPCVGAGLLLTIVLLHVAPTLAWMLPGLWQVLFGLGIFASCRFLPRAIAAAAAWYVATGLLCIGLGDARALSPWAMGLPFGVGQLLVACILYLRSGEAAHED